MRHVNYWNETSVSGETFRYWVTSTYELSLNPCPCLCFGGRWQFALGIHQANQERWTGNVKVMLYFLCIMGHTNKLYFISEESNSYLCENVIPAITIYISGIFFGLILITCWILLGDSAFFGFSSLIY